MSIRPDVHARFLGVVARALARREAEMTANVPDAPARSPWRTYPSAATLEDKAARRKLYQDRWRAKRRAMGRPA